MKDTIIENLQEDNERLKTRCSNLENKLVLLEASTSALEQCVSRKNLVLSGIADTIADDELENTVISVLGDIDIDADIDAKVKSLDIEDCNWIGKPDKANS